MRGSSSSYHLCRSSLRLAVSLFLSVFLYVSAVEGQTVQDDNSGTMLMATHIDSMASWQRYPTYEVYTAMMQHYASHYSQLCHLDTMGYSFNGRLLLSLVIETATPKRTMMYSGVIHGDEPLSYVLLLHLADTLLSSYGTDSQITSLLDSVAVVIMPVTNPDGLYRRGNNSVANGLRTNANGIDLNRNFPDPFGYGLGADIQVENQAFINYADSMRFSHSAALHSGDEVLNYPWDSFTSSQRYVEQWQWWQQVCQRFVATVHRHDSQRLCTVRNSGYVAGGDWYVIHNGRQDYMNYYHGVYEMTMELSFVKQVASSHIPIYWNAYAEALIGYIAEVPPTASPAAIYALQRAADSIKVYPNPTRGAVTVRCGGSVEYFDLSHCPTGVNVVKAFGRNIKVVKY